MKTFLRTMTVFFAVALLFPAISLTKIKIYNFKTPSKASNHQTDDSLSFYEITDEIIISNTSNFSKVKALSEAMRLSELTELKSLREVCFQRVDIDSNLKCLEEGIGKLKKNDILPSKYNIKDVILGSCMKMESYADEGACLESLLIKVDITDIERKMDICLVKEVYLEKVFCYRKYL